MNQTIVNKIAITPTLEKIVNWFSLKTAQTEAEFPLKYVQLSAHDSTLDPFMSILGLGYSNVSCLTNDLFDLVAEPNPDCSSFPSVNSNLVWELILKAGSEEKVNKDSSDYIVKFSFNGDYVDYCKTGKKDAGGQFYCELDDFYRVVKGFVYPDYKQFCGKEEPTQGEVTAEWVEVCFKLVLGLLVVFMILVLVLLYSVGKFKHLEKLKKE